MPYADPKKRLEYQRNWMAKRRQDWLAANGPCVRCGTSDDLQVDHIDPTQKVSHRIWSWAIARLNAELAKCQVLCHSCHHKKTGEQNGWGKHGSAGYLRGCRCELCTCGNTERCRTGEAVNFVF